MGTVSDKRKKDTNWLLNVLPNGSCPTGDAQLSVLMDLRDELKSLNGVLHCPNFLDIPRILRQVRRNTAKPKPKKKAVTV